MFLSHSEIFNRLPINTEQKAKLYADLITEWRKTEQKCPERTLATRPEQDDPEPVAKEEAEYSLAPKCFVPMEISER